MNDLEWAARNVHKWPTLPHDYECKMIYVDHEMDAGWGRQYPTDPIDGSEITKAQWMAERARLQNKPKTCDWPAWAEYSCQNKYGYWSFHSHKPEPKEYSGYWSSDNKEALIQGGEVLGDWRDTLEKKPERMTPPTHTNHRCVMTEVKQEWKQGELPPVGTVCVVDKCNHEFTKQFSGKIVRIIAHDVDSDNKKVAVFKVLDTVEEDSPDYHALVACKFIPLKTEEEKAVEGMLDTAGHYGTLAQKIVTLLYRAGYRKP